MRIKRISIFIILFLLSTPIIYFFGVFGYTPEHVVERDGKKFVAYVRGFKMTYVDYYDYKNIFVVGNQKRIKEFYGKGGFDPIGNTNGYNHNVETTTYYDENGEIIKNFVKFNGNLYEQSDFSIDYAGGDIPKGKITKLSEEPIPQNDGETNKEYLVGKTIYGTKNILNDLHFKENDDAIVVETHNSYILFEKVK